MTIRIHQDLRACRALVDEVEDERAKLELKKMLSNVIGERSDRSTTSNMLLSNDASLEPRH